LETSGSGSKTGATDGLQAGVRTINDNPEIKIAFETF
jgi:hypothetical protein